MIHNSAGKILVQEDGYGHLATHFQTKTDMVWRLKESW